MTVPRLFASVLGVGYIGRGGGTLAAALVVAVWMLAGLYALPLPLVVGSVAIITAVGGWSARRMEDAWGTDSSRVVVDEVAGMGIALIGLPGGWGHALAAFALFRFFDIAKPLGVARMEKLPGGWGVMGDDVLAGLYANLLMQAVVHTGLWPAP